MPTEQFSNNAQTTLSSAITSSSATSIGVASAAGFPGAAQFRVRIDDELLLVTAGAGTTTWTVTRGIEGTTATTHASGAAVIHVLTAAALQNLDAGYIATGTLGEARGGTNQGSYATGDTLYASAANTLGKLAGNTTTTRKFLRQTGTGSASAAPAWDTLTTGDMPAGVPTAAATQSDMAAASSTTVYASPGRTQYHPGVAKAWADCTGGGSPSLNDSYNVASVTRSSAGIFVVNFTTAFVSANYAAAVSASYASGSTVIPVVTTQTSSSLQIEFLKRVDGSLADPDRFRLVVFGVQ